jgi:hypothetical protein
MSEHGILITWGIFCIVAGLFVAEKQFAGGLITAAGIGLIAWGFKEKENQ